MVIHLTKTRPEGSIPRRAFKQSVHPDISQEIKQSVHPNLSPVETLQKVKQHQSDPIHKAGGGGGGFRGAGVAGAGGFRPYTGAGLNKHNDATSLSPGGSVFEAGLTMALFSQNPVILTAWLCLMVISVFIALV
uniref:Uncharacterized protein n=1 Tax=Spongospora subterranea TaxID=70186 RepID=A0A0H5QVM1_9EUKA|eukprot:CRZ05960.1 hypothetical protein [Spongospora subterranea]